MRLFPRRNNDERTLTVGGVTVVSAGAMPFTPPAPVAAAPAVEAPDSPDGGEIGTVDDLPGFERTLYDDLSLAPSLRHQICPVLVESAASAAGAMTRGRYALILTRDMATSDVTEEIQRQLRLRFDPADTAVYFAAAPVMVALARGSFDTAGANGDVAKGAGKRSSSALWQNFEAAGAFALAEAASDLHWEVEDNGG